MIKRQIQKWPQELQKCAHTSKLSSVVITKTYSNHAADTTRKSERACPFIFSPYIHGAKKLYILLFLPDYGLRKGRYLKPLLEIFHRIKYLIEEVILTATNVADVIMLVISYINQRGEKAF